MSRKAGTEPPAAASPRGKGTRRMDGEGQGGSSGESGPTKKEQFELLYGILKAYHDSSLETVLKVTGFLLLAMGWVVTSENARVFLARDTALQWASIAVLSLAAMLFALFALRVLRESRATFEALEALDYMPVQYYQTLVAKPAVAAAFVVADFVITIVLCIFVLRL